MLKDIQNVRQINGESRRQWFSSPSLDLIVWRDTAGGIGAFQFCYDKGGREKAFSWTWPDQSSHDFLDDGEEGGADYKRSPILKDSCPCDVESMIRTLLEQAEQVPSTLTQFVVAVMRRYGDQIEQALPRRVAAQ